MSASPKTEGRFRLDVRTSGDDIAAFFAARNVNKEYPLENLCDSVEADFQPHRYEISSRLRRALYNQDQLETRSFMDMKTKSKL
ncbi:hypothetical protein OESDEN_14373 [Oesophagostomum dentatum]|uniref:Uncharacterized protein n=1 Tax=Oesophagostomum dentatum TaxID=61180 RepID=A0A0B1SRP0_OESDE|nr:hypothetical protein OESDEN_14373 [Oesophagostomum dentatum]